MSTVIKVNQTHQAPHSAAFNFEDLAQNAQSYLEKVRGQAAEIVAKANQEAQQIRQKAEKEGREVGQRAIEQTVELQVGKQMETVLPALRQAIAGVEHSRQAWLLEWEKAAVHVAAAMAARVVRRELTQAPGITLTLVREALEMAAGSPQIRISLNPADHAVLGSQIERLSEEFSRISEVTLVADPQIAPGGCLLHSRHGSIDQRIESQLARIEAELS